MLSRLGSRAELFKREHGVHPGAADDALHAEALAAQLLRLSICGLAISFQLTRLEIDVSIFTSTPCAAAPKTETPEVNAA